MPVDRCLYAYGCRFGGCYEKCGDAPDTREARDVNAPRPPALRHCRECGGGYYADRLDKVFCSDACRRMRGNRAMTQGAKAYWLMVKWRQTRAKGSLAHLTRLADEFAGEERTREKARQQRIKELSGAKG